MNTPKARWQDNLPILAITIAVGLMYSGPIVDIDVWWHLATGRQIVQQGALLSSDPFSLGGDQISGLRQIVLSGYWASNVLFYLAHVLMGDYGLIALRLAMYAAIFILLYRFSCRVGATRPFTLLIMAAAIILCQNYTGTRPQILSFLFSMLLVYALEGLHARMDEGGGPGAHYIYLPLIMVAWANMHRGFMMGTAILMIYLSAETLRAALGRRLGSSAFRWYAGALLLAAASTLLNPNAYKPYVELVLLEGSVLQSKTSEYLSPITLLLKYRMYLITYWLFLALCLLLVARLGRRMPLRRVLLIGFMCAISLSAFRYIPFLVLVAGPMVAAHLSAEAGGARWAESRALRMAPALLLLALALGQAPSTLARSMESPVSAKAFPVGAVEYIREHRAAPNLFNHFSWGGYLIWKLYPEHKAFIDGRALNEEMFHAYTRILWDEGAAQGLLRKYGVNTVIAPERNPFTAEVYALPRLLMGSDEWRLVYRDDTALIFTRRQPLG